MGARKFLLVKPRRHIALSTTISFGSRTPKGVATFHGTCEQGSPRPYHGFKQIHDRQPLEQRLETAVTMG